MTPDKIAQVLKAHAAWLAGASTGVRADLRGANLCGADLCWANLGGANLRDADLQATTLCNATIDGAVVRADDIGGPGHILCALTDAEWATIREGRSGRGAAPPNPLAKPLRELVEASKCLLSTIQHERSNGLCQGSEWAHYITQAGDALAAARKALEAQP